MYRIALLLFFALLTACAGPRTGGVSQQVNDDALHTGLKTLVCRLDAHCKAIRVIVIDSRTEQAHMLPDGRMLISLGLLLATQHEDEIAFVIAHELAHRQLRHRPVAAENRTPLEIAADAEAHRQLIEHGLDPSRGTALLQRLLDAERQRMSKAPRADALDQIGITQLKARLAALRALPAPIAQTPQAAPTTDWNALLSPYRVQPQ